MAEIINFNRSVPTNFTNGVSRPLSASPTRLAAFGMTTSTLETDVVLEATVGITSTAGNPDILFSVFRGSQVIGTTRYSNVAINELDTVSFTIIDQNVPTGFFPFRITAEIVNDTALNQATVIGPIVFSGTEIQL